MAADRWSIGGSIEAGAVGTVSHGPVFDTYRLDGGEAGHFALKVLGGRRGTNGDVLVATRQQGSPLSCVSFTLEGYAASQVGAWERDAVALLTAEATTLERAGAGWNIEFVELAERHWQGEPTVGLVTRWLDGPALSELDRGAQRSLLPRMLPSLWDALSRARHGDLHAAHLIILDGGRRFALIDPGSQLYERRSTEDIADWFQRITFTTRRSAYPVLPPFYAGSSGARANLDDHLRGFFGSLWLSLGTTPEAPLYRQLDVPGPRTLADLLVPAVRPNSRGLWAPKLTPPQPSGCPLAADLHAAGALYYEILCGRGPFPGCLWWPSIKSQDGRISLCAEWAAGVPPVEPPRSVAEDVTEAEETLTLALLQLEVHDRTDLVEMCLDAAEALGPRN